KKAIDIPAGFVPHYELSKGKEKIVAEIMAKAEQADEVLLATDPDREGEAIAWHIAEAAHLKNPKRVVFYEITKEAVEEAIQHPRAIDDNLKQAQEARRVLDRLFGYDLSGLIWKKVRYGLSAGRVQSPALRIIMEREREIRAFLSHPYWIITADVSNANKEKFIVTCEAEPTDKKEVEKILAAGKSESWVVTDIKETEVQRSPRAPFITSTLQQVASTRLGFAPSRTMGLAQRLYAAGHITYMRTDSTTLSGQALGQITGVIEKDFGKNYLQLRTFAAKSKNAQEAHEAIRPTHASVKRAGSNNDEKKLYELIWTRTVASQMADAKTLRTKVTVQVGSGAVPNFVLSGARVLFDGWLKADPTARADDVAVPKMTTGETLNFHDIKADERRTEPPGRYSEAGLIKELEKRGIGRPSTYASIIDTIENRGYVDKVQRALVPTDTGDVVSSFLETNFSHYISDTFTADMEDKLDLIADGKEEYVRTLKNFYTPFKKDVKEKDKLAKATNLGDADSKFKCPVCGGKMIIKLGRGGKFMSCARYPDCDGALTMSGEQIKKDEPIGSDPVSGLPIYIQVGKYGPYVQLGERVKGKGSTKAQKPRMASIPKDKDLSSVTLADALKYLSLPKILGTHPETGLPISANIGRFGPYIVHAKDFRSLKTDDVYTIALDRALEILKEEKKTRKRGGAK
ncbi:MAG: type I DNA topoisomerase, partial [bacterium]|nr:type I DNA topoisomerase [bacterium]